MAKTFFAFCLLLFYMLEVKSQDVDYYWRDYEGEIPEDALPGGKDANNRDVYIAQIYVHGFGLYVGTIYQGKDQIEFSSYQIRKTDSSSVVKILCTGHKDHFSWLLTSAKTLYLDIVGKHAVVGGYNSKVNGIYNIGRVMYDKSTQIGAINSFHVGSAYFYFVYKNKHFLNIEDYEVLIYNKEPVRDVKTY